MIWLITVASLLGFLVVNTLANQPLMTGYALTNYEIASYDAKIWQMLSVVLLIALLINVGLYHGCNRKQLNEHRQTLHSPTVLPYRYYQALSFC